ncbi:hypothetical protein [Adhaeribacter radiodurans]|uniref:STAS/SEC14 domain-containing protein n=1 Tax=Adhaeribacter radiodurans TaxID=2745197 RepID=A0A7L7L1C2_9BACT|nr:hypothetical protein [Adhaeribacter radiodurans]QMU26584.1 hypothetical protein HUW48_00490 [Adhaeribacter radiodurans]
MKIELPNTFGNIFISISYDALHGWVYNNWRGYQTLESVMQGANACLEMIQKYRCFRLLNDNRQVVGPWDHATDWIAQDWTPRARALGLTYFAHVVSAESMARLSAEQMHVKISNSFQMQIFADYSLATEWLSQSK